jgi:hypothetical protein
MRIHIRNCTGELVKHLEELAEAMQKAVELECTAGEATLSAAAATAASEFSQKQFQSAAEAVDSFVKRRDAISRALKVEVQQHQVQTSSQKHEAPHQPLIISREGSHPEGNEVCNDRSSNLEQFGHRS